MSTNSALSKYKFLGLFPLVMAQIGTSGDNSVLTVATASLLASLNATMSDIQLANIIYSLCAGCLMIVGGMVGLIVGWKKTFRIGAAMCAVGELVVAFSGNIFMFTWGGRLLVGIGASFLIPSVLGLIPGLYKGNDRAFAFGAIGAATGIASCLGPIAAGFLIDTFDWRIAFSYMAVYFTIVFIGSLLVGDVPLPEQKVRFDLKGTVVAVAGLFLLIIGISKIPVWGLIDPIAPPVIGGSPLVLFGMSPALFIALLGLITLVFLVRIERNVEKTYGSCLIPSSFLTTPQVRSGLTVSYSDAVPLLRRVVLPGHHLSAAGRRFQRHYDRYSHERYGDPDDRVLYGYPQVQSRCFAEKDLPHGYRYGCPFDDPDGVVLKSLRS